jgi:hypothetical protein
MTDKFDIASAEWRADLIALLTALQKDIGDDYRATDDPEDDTAAMAVTIATDDELTGWSYQTGDNSYTGGCYGYPYWGVGSISRDDDPAEVADALLDDLGETWSGGQF